MMISGSLVQLTLLNRIDGKSSSVFLLLSIYHLKLLLQHLESNPLSYAVNVPHMKIDGEEAILRQGSVSIPLNQ